VFTLAFFAYPASAIPYFLSQDLGIHGQFHLCKYSNGKVYSFNTTDLCPLQVNDEGPPASSKQQGFKSGEYQDGMTKVCVYNVMGRTEALRISSTSICPLNHEF
jgi:hypothetical protein